MKYKIKIICRQIIAFVCVIALLVTQNSILVLSVDETENGKIKLEFGEDYKQKLHPRMTYNGSNEGIASFIYTLNNVENGDEVKLFAKAIFSSKDAKTQENVQLSDFYISPEFADKYELKLPDFENNMVVVNQGTILRKPIECTPDNNIHYKGELSSVNIQGCTFKDVVEGDEIALADNLRWRIARNYDGTYYYRVLGLKLDGTYEEVTTDITTNNKNYIVTASAPVVVEKPDVSAIVKLVDQGENKKLNYVDGKGIIANSSVIVSVTADANNDVNEPMVFTLYTDETQLTEPLTATKNNDGKYVADFMLELSDKVGCDSREIKNIKYKINGVKNPETLDIKLNDKSSNILILDKDAPVQNDKNPVSVTYDNKKQKVTIKGGFKDNLSEVKEIQYKIEGQNEFEKVSDTSFEKTYDYSALKDGDGDGKYNLELRVTDYADNTLEITNLGGDGFDTKSPAINDIEISVINDEIELKLENALKILDSGNYIRYGLKFEIIVKDDAENNIPSDEVDVKLFDGDKDIIPFEFVSNNITGEKIYTLEINDNRKIDDFKIYLVDKYGNSSTVALKDYLINQSNSSGIWSELTSNTWIIDKTNPEISADYGNSVVENGNKKYYNQNGGTFKISVKEINGLSEFSIKQKYKEDITEIKPELVDENNDGKYTHSINVNTLLTGWYTYTIKAVDNSGRTCEKEYTFYVDKEKPTGKIQAFGLKEGVRTDVTVIDTENWITEKDENGNNRLIKYRLYIETEGSDIESVNFVINQDSENPIVAELDESEITEYSGGLFSVPNNNLSNENETDRKYIDLVLDTSKWTLEQKEACNNTFNISAKITAVSGNDSEEISYDLHIDTEEPKIYEFTVTKYDSAIEEVLDILTFGIFSNEPIKLVVKVLDGEFDAGISEVKLNCQENSYAPIEVDGDNYIFKLPITDGESIFSSEISINVTDKMDKTTTKFPVKTTVNSDENIVDSYFVMIENTPPTATIELPTGENVLNKTNGEVWLNSNDKEINLSVEDSESGIREITVTVDVKDENGSTLISKNIGQDKNYNKLLTVEDTKINDKSITNVSYVFSTNDIATMFGKYDNENYTIKCEVVDNAGNVGKVYEKVFYRDITNPTIKQFDFAPKSENGVENTTNLITELDSNLLEYGYFFKNESETDEVKLTVTVDDTANENGGTVISSGIEKVAFRLVSAENNEDVIKYEDCEIVDNKAECIIPKNFKGKIYAQVFDMVGNKSEEKTSKAFVLDGDKPVITIEPLPNNKSKLDDMHNKLYASNVEFNVTISDKKSGLSRISYAKSSDLDSFDDVLTEINYESDYEVNKELGNGWMITEMDANLVTVVSKTFTFNTDDKNIFMIFNAVDNALNNADTVNTEKFTIDTVSPNVDKFNFKPVTEDNISESEEFIEELEYGFYFKKAFNAIVSVEDKTPSSGLDKVLFKLVEYDNGEIVSEKVQGISVENQKAVCTIPAGFKGQVYAQVYDRASNKSEEQTPQAFVVDEVPPVIKIEPLPDNKSKIDMAGNKLYTGEVKFKVTISDEKAGLRELVYSKTSEKDSFNDVVTTINNISGYKENDIIENGWQVTKTDKNLITEVSQVFTFTNDDNDIVMNFTATDRSKNTCATEKSEAFTIDTISPKVTIENADEPINEMYYKGSTTFVVTVTERNFDPALMLPDITNTYTDAKVPYEFVTSATDSNVHTATFVFQEGDYGFAFTGTDRGGYSTEITTRKNPQPTTRFFTSFNVDATAPVLSTNFEEFGATDDKQIYFNTSKTASIEVVEHNFFEYDMNIVVQSKASGTAHDASGDGWYDIGFASDWKHIGDKHTLQIKFEDDGVYKISISPTDCAGNKSSSVSSAIYEIDKTMPEIYSRNNKFAREKDFVKSPYYMIYDEKDKKNNKPAPSIEFEDLNFDRIEIEAVIYRPEYKNGREMGEIKVDSLSEKFSVPVKKNQFTLPNFDKDGVYSITYVAVDKAGNKSEPINDTYFRMVDTDVLAYISNSSLENKTGYYSLMDKVGSAISKKASDFKDITINVIKLKNDKESGVLMLREDDKEYSPEGYTVVKSNEISETAEIIETQLLGSYFSETFRDDSLDTRMYLSVSIDKNVYLDLASIHIDNEKPIATIPEDFVNWHNYFFTEEVKISLTNISETLNADLCKVYECPRNGERTEISFEYNKEEKMLTFALKEGLHNIDITLVDEAGNEWNLARVKNLRVGNFRLYTGAGVSVVIIGAIVGVVLWRRKKQH